MQEVTPKAVETICEGGFRIEIRSDELTVSRDATANTLAIGSIVLRVLAVLVLGAIAVRLLFDSAPTLASAPLSALAAATVLIGAIILWTRSARINNLHCTRKNIEVIRIVRGHETGKRRFPRTRVRQISFTAVSWSNAGPTFALVFKVEGKEMEVLRGIESPEAQTALRELQRLGFDVELDVGMPMMVEMALERRRNPDE